MSKELKIKGALSKDYQQIYIEDSPTNLFINEDGRIKTKSIKDDVSDGSLRISSDAKFSINSSGILELISDTHTEIALNDGANKPFRMTNGLNTVCGFSAESGSESTFQMFEAGGDSSDDYFSIRVLENGETELKTVDGAGVVGHLTLDTDGDITLDAASGNIYCKDNGGNYTPGSDYEIATKKYVDDNAGGGGSQKWSINCGFYAGTNALRYIPLVAGLSEQSLIIDYTIDDINYIVPYNLDVNTIYLNVTKQTSGQSAPGNTSMKLYKDGSAISNNVTVNLSTVGYDTTDLYEVYTFDFSSETNSYSAGDTMQISIDSTSTLYYVSATICGLYT